MFNQQQVSGYYSITDPNTGRSYHVFTDPRTGRSYRTFTYQIIIRGYRIFKDPYTQEWLKVYVDQNQRILSPDQYIFCQYINGEPRIAYKICVAPKQSRARRAHPTVLTQEGAAPVDVPTQPATAAPAQAPAPAQASVGFTSQIEPQLSPFDFDDQLFWETSWET